MPRLAIEDDGTEDDDRLIGTSERDTLRGLGGDDRISGRAGDDVLFGGDDDDRISGGRGDDDVFGDSGRDELAGGIGDDNLRGGGGADLYLFDPSREDEGRDDVRGFDVERDKIVLDVEDVIDATPDLLEEIIAGGGDVGAVLDALDESDAWGLRENDDGDVVISHPNGRIRFVNLSADEIESFADIGGALVIEGLGEALTDIADETGVPESIGALVADSGGGFDEDEDDFDILLAAATEAGLADELADEDASLSVFAPTDAAFISFAERLGFGGGGEEDAFEFIAEALGSGPIPELVDLLNYHIVDGAETLGELQAEGQIETLFDARLRISGDQLIDRDSALANAEVIAADLQTGNGVIHAVDEVLLPFDI